MTAATQVPKFKKDKLDHAAVQSDEKSQIATGTFLTGTRNSLSRM
jgi:hypothetical protein